MNRAFRQMRFSCILGSPLFPNCTEETREATETSSKFPEIFYPCKKKKKFFFSVFSSGTGNGR